MQCRRSGRRADAAWRSHSHRTGFPTPTSLFRMAPGRGPRWWYRKPPPTPAVQGPAPPAPFSGDGRAWPHAGTSPAAADVKVALTDFRRARLCGDDRQGRRRSSEGGGRRGSGRRGGKLEPQCARLAGRAVRARRAARKRPRSVGACCSFPTVFVPCRYLERFAGEMRFARTVEHTHHSPSPPTRRESRSRALLTEGALPPIGRAPRVPNPQAPRTAIRKISRDFGVPKIRAVARTVNGAMRHVIGLQEDPAGRHLCPQQGREGGREDRRSSGTCAC